jgi:EAL domain-containing protein (putative c-di-GMP-specific phosphodiesterase class I)
MPPAPPSAAPLAHRDLAAALPAAAPVRRILIAGFAGLPRLVAALAGLVRQALPAGDGAALHLAVADDPALLAAEPPDLLLLGPGADARAWLAAARQAAPSARRILLAEARDSDAARLARRHGASLFTLAADGASPATELAARCAEALAARPAATHVTRSPAVARRRRGPERGSRTAEQRRREADLARALACGELALHYQPVVDLRSGRVLGAEALARWPHPAMGIIPPNDFIPVAEACGLILDLGAWALRAAAAEAATWTGRSLVVSANVSPKQIDAGVLPAQVRAALQAARLPPARLQIEITEGVLIETSQKTIDALKAVRDMGVAIALDDFGTGYASLAAVRRLPLTAIKVDRSFVSGLGSHGGEDLVIVRAMAEMARALNLAVVAEGVETDAQRTALIGLGITEGQGWLFGRPQPAIALARHFKG